MLQVEFNKNKDSIIESEGFTLEDFEYLYENNLFPQWTENFLVFTKNAEKINDEINLLANDAIKKYNYSKSKAIVYSLFTLADNFQIIFNSPDYNKSFSLTLQNKTEEILRLTDVCKHINSININIYDTDEKLPNCPITLKNIEGKVFLSLDKEKICELIKKELENFTFDIKKEIRSIKNNFNNNMTELVNKVLITSGENISKIPEKHKDFSLSKDIYLVYNKINKYKTYLKFNIHVEAEEKDQKYINLLSALSIIQNNTSTAQDYKEYQQGNLSM